MPHKNYYRIRANSHYELGLQKGRIFGDSLRESIQYLKKGSCWDTKLNRSKCYLETTTKTFPHLIEELKGYAYGAEVSFDELWVCLEDEPYEGESDKCTSVVTNNGLLIAHNEDWEEDAEDQICVLKKTVGDLTILELFYLNTLGGNSISINSNGFVQAINSLAHSDEQIGIPRDVVARWLSETKSPEEDYEKLVTMKRASGYNHILVGMDGNLWNIECSARELRLTRPDHPFVHTNHFLTELRELEGCNDKRGTYARYDYVSSHVTNSMALDTVMTIMSDTSQGPKLSVCNEMTVARVIIDLESMNTYIWLLREREKGWIKYDIDFINPE